jgi:hypothetical protein
MRIIFPIKLFPDKEIKRFTERAEETNQRNIPRTIRSIFSMSLKFILTVEIIVPPRMNSFVERVLFVKYKKTKAFFQ